MPGTFYISGLFTGMDWDNVINQIIQIERRQIDVLESQKKIYEDKLSAWQDLNTKLLNVKTQAEALSDADAFSIFTTNLSASSGNAEDYVTATAGPDATVGTYEFTIKQLAAAKVDKTANSFTSMTDALNFEGVLQLRKTGTSEWTSIFIETSDSLENIKDKINQVTDETGVIASIVKYADNDYRLVLAAKDTGEANAFEINSAATITVDSTTYDNLALPTYLGIFASTDADGNGTEENVIQQAQNAIVNIYGQDAERSSNTITDLIPGVTLNLLQADETVTIALNVDRDIDSIANKISDLFNKLNDVFSYISNQYEYSEDSSAPPLIGDTTLSFLRGDLKSRLVEGVTIDSTTHYLWEFGIRTNEDGTYEVDTEALKSALQSDFDTVVSFFTNTDTGLALRLEDFLDFVTDEYSNGYVHTRMDELQSNIDNINERIEEMEKRLDMERESLYRQFNTLEKYMAQMQQTQTWLNQQLAALR